MACYKRNISSSKTAIVIKSKQYRCYSMNTAGVFFPTPFQAPSSNRDKLVAPLEYTAVVSSRYTRCWRPIEQLRAATNTTPLASS